jgi:hypothetical protein
MNVFTYVIHQKRCYVFIFSKTIFLFCWEITNDAFYILFYSFALQEKNIIIIIFYSQQCIASNEFESVQSSAELSLSDDPPHFTYVFGQMEPLRTGYGLSLKCSATGLPLPQIVWTLDGSPISEHSRLRIGDYVTTDGMVNSYVNISSIRTEDGGMLVITYVLFIFNYLFYLFIIIRIFHNL